MAASQLSNPVLPTELPNAMPSTHNMTKLKATHIGDQRAP
jgi:hypothetical protein